MTDNKQTGAAARLRAHAATLETAIVDVPAPSGFVYKFKKPSRFGMLFELGTLPQAGAADAITAWMEAGVIPEEGGAAAENIADVFRTAMDLRDRVLDLSYEPKFVLGKPQNDDEVCVSDGSVPDEDLDYLFKWVAAGGDKSAMLKTFPGGQRANALASASRRKVRNKAESAGASA